MLILLIAPYGIEMRFCWQNRQWYRSFNCTLWNWNLGVIITTAGFDTFNCTLWNWNLGIKVIVRADRHLLIAPYGIEIRMIQMMPAMGTYLLIAPYGIEIKHIEVHTKQQYTFNCTLWNWNSIVIRISFSFWALLIAPYGIEILYLLLSVGAVPDF